MIIIVDTREQLPYWAPPEAQRIALVVGDYTTEKLRGRFHVERKSLADLYGTLTSGHRRFRREILRAQKHDIQLVVVIEGTKKDMAELKFPRGNERKTPGFVIVRIADTVSKKYGVEFIWTKDRDAAKWKTLTLLENEFSKLKQINSMAKKPVKSKSVKPKAKVPTSISITPIQDQLQELVASGDVEKFNEGNQASATRIRNAAQAIKKLCGQLRKDVIEIKKSRR